MKQIFVLLSTVAIALCLWLGVRSALQRKAIAPISQQFFVKNHLYLPGTDFEEELIFFLAQQMGTYEGEFEILDVVNLKTQNITGVDYILITLRAPNGSLCQVTIAKESLPWARWQLVPGSFSTVKFPESDFKFSIDTPPWMRELGITPEQVVEYLATHPGLSMGGDVAFLDKKTQRYTLPVDWSASVKKDKPLRFSVNKNKQIGFSNVMSNKSQIGLLNTYWKADYSPDVSGPGYRSYLYGKTRGEQ